MYNRIFYICYVFNFMCNISSMNNDIQEQNFLHFLKPCRLSDPDFSICVQKHINNLRPLLNNGIPELGIPGCNPFQIPDIVLDQGTKAINITGRGSNIKIYGGLNFHIDNFNYDLNNLQLNFCISFPKLKAVGLYVVHGEIMQIPIYGAGEAIGHFYNVNTTITAQGEVKNINGVNYLQMKDLFVDLDLGHVEVDIKGLFGNKKKEIADSIIAFINKNWKMLAEELIPLFKGGFIQHMKNILNSILEKYSIEEWLPK